MTAVADAAHELDAPPWHRVEATLMAVSRAIRRAYDLRLRSIGLTLSEASLLAFLREQGATTQTVIAQRIGMGRASAGSLGMTTSTAGLPFSRGGFIVSRRVRNTEKSPD